MQNGGQEGIVACPPGLATKLFTVAGFLVAISGIAYLFAWTVVTFDERPDLNQNLSNDPRPPGSKKLTGRPTWRIRVGVYRVIYEVHDDRPVVLILVVGHRGEVYR